VLNTGTAYIIVSPLSTVMPSQTVHYRPIE